MTKTDANNPRRPPAPAPDVVVQGATAAASYGPRVDCDGGIVEPARSAASADFWAVYEWRPSANALEGGWWDWRADCDTEDTARTLAEAIAGEYAERIA